MIYSKFNCAKEASLVGNKSFFLDRINKVCEVPPYITLGTNLFMQLLSLEENSGLKELIMQTFINKLGIVFKLDEIRDGIKNMYIPQSIKNEILETLNKCGVKAPYAVRSSSTMEDGNKQSAAGVYESYCDVSVDELFEKIRECWMSNFTVKALCYEDMNDNIEQRMTSMGVIIQEFIYNADFAGVFFSVNPINPSEGSMIEYVKGTAEKLMSGVQQANTVSLGFFEKDIDRTKYSFEEEWMYDLLKIGYELKQLIGTDVDVEWVVVENKVLVIQCRPVTSKSDVEVTEWICSVADADTIPKAQMGGLEAYIEHLKKKKIPFYKACEKTGVRPIGWLMVRYHTGTDLLKLQKDIVDRCGKGYYAIMFNTVLLDFQCTDEKLSLMLDKIIKMSDLSCVTVSIKYIPHNEMSCISYYDANTVRIECVPGIMKGIKSGYLQPTLFWVNKEGKIIESEDVVYTTYYDIDLETDTFFEPKVNMSIYENIKPYISNIAEGTRTLHQAGILGDIEWWICDGEQYVTDYSIETDAQNTVTSSQESLSYISAGDIMGNILLLGEEELAELEYLSYGCSISVDKYDDRVHEMAAIQTLMKKIDVRKEKFERVILAVPKPLLGLSPLLTSVDGVVFKWASRLCHLSVILREKHIPAIEIGDEFDKLSDEQSVNYTYEQ